MVHKTTIKLVGLSCLVGFMGVSPLQDVHANTLTTKSSPALLAPKSASVSDAKTSGSYSDTEYDSSWDLAPSGGQIVEINDTNQLDYSGFTISPNRILNFTAQGSLSKETVIKVKLAPHQRYAYTCASQSDLKVTDVTGKVIQNTHVTKDNWRSGGVIDASSGGVYTFTLKPDGQDGYVTFGCYPLLSTSEAAQFGYHDDSFSSNWNQLAKGFAVDTTGSRDYLLTTKVAKSEGGLSNTGQISYLKDHYDVYNNGALSYSRLGNGDTTATDNVFQVSTTVGLTSQDIVKHEHDGDNRIVNGFDVIAFNRDDSFKTDVSTQLKDITGHTGDYYRKEIKRLNVFDRLTSFLADPVDTFAGNFKDDRTLLQYSGANALKFELSYDSIANDSQAIGGGYTHNFEISLQKTTDGVSVNWSPNRVSDFKADDNGIYHAVDARQESTKVEKTATGYLVTSQDGSTYNFSDKGQIQKSVDKMGVATQYTYTDNKLSHVENDRHQWFDFKYNSNGFLASVSDKTGRTLNFTYDDDNQLTNIETPDNNNYGITYDDHHRINKLEYADKTLVENEYDVQGRVSEQTNAKGVTSTFKYDVSDDKIVTTVNNGDSDTVMTHDTKGNLLSSVDGDHHETNYTYNASNQQTSMTDANHKKTTYVYDANNHLVEQTAPSGQQTKFDYDGDDLTKVTTPDSHSAVLMYDKHRLTSSTDKNGVTTNYQYDDHGNVLSLSKGQSHVDNTYDDNGYLISTTQNGLVTHFENDALGRVVKTTLPDQSVLQTKYDTNGNVISVTKPDKSVVKKTYNAFGQLDTSTDENDVETEYSYDDNGLLTEVHVGDLTTAYSYDKLDQLVSVDVNGAKQVSYSYDHSGHVVSTTDGSGHDTSMTYDPVGNVLSQTTGSKTLKYVYNDDYQVSESTDGNGGKTSQSYDNAGNLVKSVSPNGVSTDYTYDLMGNVTSVKSGAQQKQLTYDDNGNVVSQTDGNGNVTKYSYDVNNRLVSTTNALGEVTHNKYNQLGQLSETTNNRDQTIAKYDYNANGKVSKITDGNGNTQGFVYDASGQLVSVLDGYGRVVEKQQYDDNARVVASINALNAQTSYSYSSDSDGTKTTSTDSNYNDKSVQRNANGQVVSAQDSITKGATDYTATGGVANQSVGKNQNKTSYSYDNNDNVTGEINNDSSIKYTYDAQNQLSSWLNARGQKTNYQYDDNGQVINAKADDVENKYAYDKNGNETQADNATGKVGKTYDALNRVVSQTFNNKTVKYTYDDLGNLETLTYPDGKTVKYTYDVMGRMLLVTDWANHKTTYDYDKNNRLVKTTYFNGVTESRAYDKAGQVTGIKTVKDKTVLDKHTYTYDDNGNLITGDNQNYEYDSLNRLTSGQSQFTYDVVGNITVEGKNKFTYDSDSRLTKINGVATKSDNDGNLTNYTLSGQNHTASYNSQNQLTKFDEINYSYDADGNRVYNGAVYASGELLSDNDYTYVYGANGLVSFSQDNKFYINAYNNRGDVTKTIDNTGKISGTIKYTDYGAVVSQTGVTSTFKYAGQYGAITDDNGLVYLKTRYYNPQLMRFMNRDTVAGSITDSQSLNRFSYVEGNPLTYVDLNGQARTWITEHAQDIFLYTELGLAGLGMIPILSDVTNILLIGMDLSVGDFGGVALDAVGLIPFGNDVSNSMRLASISAKIGKTAGTAEKVNVAEKAVKSQKYEVALRPKYEVATKPTKVKPKTDFYVKENGDVVPAIGYRYINSKYEDVTRKSMTVPKNDNGNYLAFKKFDSSKEVQNAYQISPDWNDVGVVGEFDTLQVIDDIQVPTMFQNTSTTPEPLTSAYPEFGAGGEQQLITKKELHLQKVERLNP